MSLIGIGVLVLFTAGTANLGASSVQIPLWRFRVDSQVTGNVSNLAVVLAAMGG